MEKIMVLGASGTVGAAVFRQLSQNNMSQKGTPPLPAAGVLTVSRHKTFLHSFLVSSGIGPYSSFHIPVSLGNKRSLIRESGFQVH